jgi:hypothetical protein
MKPDKEQFPSCDSCGKPIAGEVNEVKTRGARGSNVFHKTPEECATAAPGRKPLPNRPKGTPLLANKITGIKDSEPEDKIYD